MKLKNIVSVVTGGSRGIGRAIAIAQANAGARVAVISRSAGSLDETVHEITKGGGEAIAVAADLTNQKDVDTAFDRIADELGAPDLVVNNAGSFLAIGPIWESEVDQWWRDIEINIKSTFLCSRRVLPGMIKRGSGRIINLIGGGTAGPLPPGSAYATSKSGIMRFTECVAGTLSDTGVFVFAMAPGLVKTDMTEHQLNSEAGKKYMPLIAKRFADGDYLPPEKAAELAVEIATGRFDRLNGRALSAWDDLDVVKARMDEWVEEDKRVLRLPGFGPTLKPDY
ncbi:MAG: SDR family oxidoreductase [Pseudomonadota bacterium]